MLQWQTLKRTLTKVDIDKANLEEILLRDFGLGQPYVNFTRYWRGMEVILRTCGSYQEEGLERDIQDAVTSLRAFRDSVLESSSSRSAAGVGNFTMTRLLRLCESLQREAASRGSHFVAEYWQENCALLVKEGGEEAMTDDKIASVLCNWLGELIRDDVLEGDSEHGLHFEQHPNDQSPVSSGVEPEPEDSRRWGPDSPSNPHYHDSDDRTQGLSVKGLNADWGWLAVTKMDQPAEVTNFQDNLIRSLSGCRDQIRFSSLYRAMRDSFDEDCVFASAPPAAGFSAVSLRVAAYTLNAVVLKQIRPIFRKLDARIPQSVPRPMSIVMQSPAEKLRARARGGIQSSNRSSLIAELLCSQAKAAEVLERRCKAVPWAYRLNWLLARARRRALHGCLSRWRYPTTSREITVTAPQAGPFRGELPPPPAVPPPAVSSIPGSGSLAGSHSAGVPGAPSGMSSNIPSPVAAIGSTGSLRAPVGSTASLQSPMALGTGTILMSSHSPGSAPRRWGAASRNPAQPTVMNPFGGGSGALYGTGGADADLTAPRSAVATADSLTAAPVVRPFLGQSAPNT